MGILTFIIFILCFLKSNGKESSSDLDHFPDSFFIGTGTAAYEVEGGWNADGKGLSIWDHMMHNYPNMTMDNSNGDIADNTYYMYKDDVQHLKNLGAKAYRFSISWARILPQGQGSINQLGIDYYNNLINELIAYGIDPHITLYHWDLPQALSELGGWLTEDVVDWFDNYARIVFNAFGDRVKHWFTVNEPYYLCFLGYEKGTHAPRIQWSGVGYYKCAKNVLLAHARAYHIYDEEFRPQQKGEIGIVLSMDYAIPATDSQSDVDALEDYYVFSVKHYMDPIFTEQGNYPQHLIEKVANMSISQGYEESRLPPLSDYEVEYIKGTSDFLAINSYTVQIIFRNDSLMGVFDIPSLEDDAGYGMYENTSEAAEVNWMWLQKKKIVRQKPRGQLTSEGFYKLLINIKNIYNNPKLYVTENGKTTNQGLNDTNRVTYIRNYLKAILNARNKGANIQGYLVWSYVDCFEWNSGYTEKYGLFEVNMNDTSRKRIPRKSAFVLKEIIRSRTIDYSYDIDPYTSDLSNQCYGD